MSRYNKHIKTNASDNQLLGLRVVIFGIMGAIQLWLWQNEASNQYSLYLGLALILGAIISGLEFLKCITKKSR